MDNQNTTKYVRPSNHEEALSRFDEAAKTFMQTEKLPDPNIDLETQNFIREKARWLLILHSLGVAMSGFDRLAEATAALAESSRRSSETADKNLAAAKENNAASKRHAVIAIVISVAIALATILYTIFAGIALSRSSAPLDSMNVSTTTTTITPPVESHNEDAGTAEPY